MCPFLRHSRASAERKKADFLARLGEPRRGRRSYAPLEPHVALLLSGSGLSSAALGLAAADSLLGCLAAHPPGW